MASVILHHAACSSVTVCSSCSTVQAPVRITRRINNNSSRRLFPCAIHPSASCASNTNLAASAAFSSQSFNSPRAIVFSCIEYHIYSTRPPKATRHPAFAECLAKMIVIAPGTSVRPVGRISEQPGDGLSRHRFSDDGDEQQGQREPAGSA